MFGKVLQISVLLAAIILAAGCGKSTPVTPAPQDTEDLVAPAPPSGTGAAVRVDRAKIFWNPNSEPDVVGYNVYWYNPAPGSDNSYSKMNQTAVRVTNYVRSDIETGKVYYFRVSAIDRSGNESRLSHAIQITGGVTQEQGGPPEIDEDSRPTVGP